jgi:hypothetical protein
MFRVSLLIESSGYQIPVAFVFGIDEEYSPPFALKLDYFEHKILLTKNI